MCLKCFFLKQQDSKLFAFRWINRPAVQLSHGTTLPTCFHQFHCAFISPDDEQSEFAATKEKRKSESTFLRFHSHLISYCLLFISAWSPGSTSQKHWSVWTFVNIDSFCDNFTFCGKNKTFYKIKQFSFSFLLKINK